MAPEALPSTGAPAVAEALEARLVLAAIAVDSSALTSLKPKFGDAPSHFDLRSVFKDSAEYVRFEFKGYGTVDVELFAESAGKAAKDNPAVSNFLKYANADAYDGTILHRVQLGAIVQGGEFDALQAPIVTAPPAVSATSAGTNLRGTLALPARGAKDGSPTGWLFNLADRPSANSVVFGRVFGDGGLPVLDKLAALPTQKFPEPFESIPIVNKKVVKVQDVRKLDTYPTAGTVPSALTFEVSSADPSIVSASVSKSELLLKYLKPGKTKITLTVKEGGAVVQTLPVDVTVAASDLGTLDKTKLKNDGKTSVSLAADFIVLDTAAQTDGKFILSGSRKAASNPDSDIAIARINDVTGAADSAFANNTPSNIGLPNSSRTNDVATAVTVQSGGKILFCGYVQSTTPDAKGRVGSDIILGRLTSTGAWDTTFGEKDSTGARRGYTLLNVKVGTNQPAFEDVVPRDPSAPTVDRAYALAIRPDGKIVVVGSSDANDTTTDMLVARFQSNGEIDTTFGQRTGEGVTLVTFGRVKGDETDTDDRANAVTLQDDGKIVAVGSARKRSDGFSGFSIIRLNSNGTPDDTFGTRPDANGKRDGRYAIAAKPAADIPGRTPTSEAFAVDVQKATGKIVIGGTFASVDAVTGGDFQSDFGLIRLNKDGSLDKGTSDSDEESGPDTNTKDATFGGVGGDRGGRTVTGLAGSQALTDLKVQSDGSIIVTGKTVDERGTATTADDVVTVIAAGYDQDGSLDAAFGDPATPGTRALFTLPAPPAATQATQATPLQPLGTLPVSAALTTSEVRAMLRAKFTALVSELQGYLALRGGAALVGAGRGGLAQVAVLESDGAAPAVFIDFQPVRGHLTSSTFLLTVVDDEAVDRESLTKEILRLLKDNSTFLGSNNAQWKDLKIFERQGAALVPADSDADVLVAQFTFEPGRGAWDESYDGDYDFEVVSGRIKDARGNAVKKVRFDNRLNVKVASSDDAPAVELGSGVFPLAADQESFEFSVLYSAGSDAAGKDFEIDKTTIGTNDVTVTSDDGATELVITGATVADQGGRQLRVTYTASKKQDGDVFTQADNETVFKVSVAAGEVSDNAADPHFAIPQVLAGSLILNVAPPPEPPPVMVIPQSGPTAAFTVGAINEIAARFTVTYSTAEGTVDPLTIDGAIRVKAPDGSFPAFTPLGQSSPTAKTIVATYELKRPAGQFTPADNGTYTVELLENTVESMFEGGGRAAAEANPQLGSFEVNVIPLGPDFEVDDVSRLKTTTFLPGQSGSITVKLKNSSADQFGGAGIAVKLMLRPSGGDSLVPLEGGEANVTFPALVSGKRSKPPAPAKLTFKIPVTVPAGSYELVPALTSGVPEKATANNVTAFGTVQIVAPDVSVTVPTVTIGRSQSFSFSVRNETSVTLPGPASVKLEVISAADGTVVTTLTGKDLSRRKLSPGRPFAIRFKGSLPAGTYALRAVADPLTGEVQTANNTALSDPFTVS